MTEDDLLKGFDPTGPSRGRLGGFFAITIGASLYVWRLAFTFGAYGTLIYHHRQRLFVLSLVVLFGSLIMRPRLQFHPWLLVLFAPPLLLTVLQLAVPIDESVPWMRFVDQILVIATFVVLPFIGWISGRLIAPTYFTLPDRRTRLAVVAVVVAVALIGYAAGRFNDRFLTCGDFKVAGDDIPKNCAHEPNS